MGTGSSEREGIPSTEPTFPPDIVLGRSLISRETGGVSHSADQGLLETSALTLPWASVSEDNWVLELFYVSRSRWR